MSAGCRRARGRALTTRASRVAAGASESVLATALSVLPLHIRTKNRSPRRLLAHPSDNHLVHGRHGRATLSRSLQCGNVRQRSFLAHGGHTRDPHQQFDALIGALLYPSAR